jgi:hypothetical protein
VPMQVGAGHRANEVSNEAPTAVAPRTDKHSRYTGEVQATRRWLREAMHNAPGAEKRPYLYRRAPYARIFIAIICLALLTVWRF